MEKKMLRNIETKQIHRLYDAGLKEAAETALNEKNSVYILNNDYIVSACLPYIIAMAKGVYRTTRFVSSTLKRKNK
jgi:hypothetical protein